MEAGLMWWAQVFRQVILGRGKTPCPWGGTYTIDSKSCNMASCLRCPWMNVDVSSWHCCLHFPHVKLREFCTVPILSCLPIRSSEEGNFISLVWRVEIAIAKETISSVSCGSGHTPELSPLFVAQIILSIRDKSPVGQHTWTSEDTTHRKNLPLETMKKSCPMDGGGGSMARRAGCVFCSFQCRTTLELIPSEILDEKFPCPATACYHFCSPLS